jgi:hypothetical protein
MIVLSTMKVQEIQNGSNKLVAISNYIGDCLQSHGFYSTDFS